MNRMKSIENELANRPAAAHGRLWAAIRDKRIVAQAHEVERVQVSERSEA